MFNLHAGPDKSKLHLDILRCDVLSFRGHVCRMLTLGWLTQEDIPLLRKWIKGNDRIRDVLDVWENVLQSALRTIHETSMQQVCISESDVCLYFASVLDTV